MIIISAIIGILISHKAYIILGDSISPDNMTFPESLNIFSIFIAATLNFIFLLLANFFLKKKIKNVDLKESLETIE